MPTPTRRFPAGFLWGTATGSYQIEGAVAHAEIAAASSL